MAHIEASYTYYSNGSWSTFFLRGCTDRKLVPGAQHPVCVHAYYVAKGTPGLG